MEKNPTSYRLRSGGAHESHNSHGVGAHSTEKHRGSITNQWREGNSGVLDLSEWSPTAGSRPLWAPAPGPARCSLEAGGSAPCHPPFKAKQLRAVPPQGLRGKGGPSSGEDATPTALIALIPRRGLRWGCRGRGPRAAADSGGSLGDAHLRPPGAQGWAQDRLCKASELNKLTVPQGRGPACLPPRGGRTADRGRERLRPSGPKGRLAAPRGTWAQRRVP